jgi:hypothetical protein
MERYAKELDALRWENANSRRGEVEVGILFDLSFFPFYFVFKKYLDRCDDVLDA